MARPAQITRKTKETDIEVSVRGYTRLTDEEAAARRTRQDQTAEAGGA